MCLNLPVDLVPFDKLVKQIGCKVGATVGCSASWLAWAVTSTNPSTPERTSKHTWQAGLQATALHAHHAAGWCAQAPFDVMGMITSVGTVGSVKRKADNSDVNRREVTLADSR